MTVPEKGHLLFEWPARHEHAIHPPVAHSIEALLVLATTLLAPTTTFLLGHGADFPKVHRCWTLEREITHEIWPALIVNEPVHHAREPQAVQPLHLFLGTAEAGTDEQVTGIGQAERSFRLRLEPGFAVRAFAV